MKTMRDYQIATRETAIYPEAGQGTVAALSYVGLGLGEAGEVQGKLKKIIRDGNGQVTPERVDEVLDEAGDALWYFARLFDELGTTFEEVAQRNLNKLYDRKERGVLGGSGDHR